MQRAGAFDWNRLRVFPEVGLGSPRMTNYPGANLVIVQILTSRNTIHQAFSYSWRKGQPSARQDVPSHKHGLDTGPSPSNFSGFSPSTGRGNTICRGRAFTLAGVGE